LEAAGIKVAAIHGNKSQGQREAALGDFRAGRIRGLVATDIAARGIDIDEVTHVVNYELPNVPESYVHRIGRTARAGAEGIAISLCGSEERPFLRDIERLTRQTIPSTDRRDRGAAGDDLNGGARPDPRERSKRPQRAPNRQGRGWTASAKPSRHRSAAFAR
jgi:ATP-dependent RNA helicase RhlE